MKKVLFTLSIIFCFHWALKAQSVPAIELATKITDKMKDSLQLSEVQRSQIYTVNIELHQQKLQARSRWQNHDSVGPALQQVENSRDSLYRPILSASQYDLYKQKKRWLVSAN